MEENQTGDISGKESVKLPVPDNMAVREGEWDEVYSGGTGACQAG